MGSDLQYVQTLLRTVPTNSKVFLHSLLNLKEKQILTGVIEIQKENGGLTARTNLTYRDKLE